MNEQMQGMIAHVQEFMGQCGNDLNMLQTAVTQSFHDRSLDAVYALPSHAIYTGIALIVIVHLSLVCCSRKGRRIVIDVVDTVAALVLVGILIVFVLGLPIGRFQ